MKVTIALEYPIHMRTNVETIKKKPFIIQNQRRTPFGLNLQWRILQITSVDSLQTE